MKQENGYYIWNKSDKPEYLSNWFKTNEMSCKCSYDTCVEQRISVELIEKLSTIREETNSVVRVTSAFRCEKKQADIRNSGTSTVVAKKSQHELGNAVDISSGTLTISEFNKVLERYFGSIGYAQNFSHVDMRPKRADGSLRTWKY